MSSSVLMNHPNIGLGFANGQSPSSMPLITGECSVSEFPSLFVTGDSRWDSNFERPSPRGRDKAKIRYIAKRKMRKYV